MHRIWLQTRGQSVFPSFAEYRLADSLIVRQHADNEIAVEQISDAEFRLQAEMLHFRHTVRTANMGDHPAAPGRQIGCYGAAHATQPDKADASVYWPRLAIPTVGEIHVSNSMVMISGSRSIALHPARLDYCSKTLLGDPGFNRPRRYPKAWRRPAPCLRLETRHRPPEGHSWYQSV